MARESILGVLFNRALGESSAKVMGRETTISRIVSRCRRDGIPNSVGMALGNAYAGRVNLGDDPLSRQGGG